MEFLDLRGKTIKKPPSARINFRPAAYGIIIENHHILCVKPPWNDKFEFPGGRVEMGEYPEESVCRETLEETSYHCSLISKEPYHFFTTAFYLPLNKKFYQGFNLIYRLKRISSEPEDMPPTREVEEVRWIPLADLSHDDFPPFLEEVITKLIHDSSIQ